MAFEKAFAQHLKLLWWTEAVFFFLMFQIADLPIFLTSLPTLRISQLLPQLISFFFFL